MSKILGSAVIRHDGSQFHSKLGATLDPGGFVGQAHTGPGRVWGISRRWEPGKLTFAIAAHQDVSLLALRNMTDATITFKGDNGMSFLLTECSAGDAISLNEESGEINCDFVFVECEEI
ncbi:phage tail protein [Agarivorans sp. B2Z047]|uniref:phage tail tube protein n=1 Tax=Agarivorans sp. B2Z047 TaxID=2652721 RepID=UPI00128AE750|nr:phage tail tube protein [Agarivorans sp. B2Z047]MPW31793.1 phage tail protein [Agarivorans sp. B2Z047]UQN43742.1 phage tail tube protein [Agarivorans sp. B2Z047]